MSLKLQHGNAYIVFQIVTSGTRLRGVQVTEGRRTRNRHTPGKPDFYWFDVANEAELVYRMATLIRPKLDKDYQPVQVQRSLFGALETYEGLFDEEEDQEQEPVLAKALAQARELPSSLKWYRVILAGPQSCNRCARELVSRAIAFSAKVKMPSGTVLYLECPDCRQAAEKPAETPQTPLFQVRLTTGV